MPHIDKLAAEGLTCLDANSGSAVCTPTRYGILTGRYAWRTYLQSGVIKKLNKGALIRKEMTSVPQLLKRANYATAAIGKWHLGFKLKAADGRGVQLKPDKKSFSLGAPVGTIIIDGPTDRGFDYYFGFHHAAYMSTLIENDRIIEDQPVNTILGLLGDKSCAYIAEQAKRPTPFFLYLPLNSPHSPIAPSAPWQGKGITPYADFVMETDHVVGRVLQAISDAGIADNTLVIFTSDNGCSPAPAQCEKLESKYGHYASGPYRGYKRSTWEGGHRVPFIVRWPGKVKAGSKTSQLICLTDLMATCADLLDLPLSDEEGVDSISILPTILGKGPSTRKDVIHHSNKGYFAIRQGKWKYIYAWGFGSGDDAPQEGQLLTQLYDMEADAGETKNLVASHPEVVAQLDKLIAKQVASGRSTPGAIQTNDAEVDYRKAYDPNSADE